MAESDHWIVTRLALELGREVVDAPGVQEALQRIVDGAPAVAGFDACSVTLVDRTRYRTAVSSDPAVTRADELQYELDEGPCVDAAQDQEHYTVRDVARDSRWPRWGPQAAQLGIGSVVAVRVPVDKQVVGAINLYCRDPRDFDVDDLATGYLVAGQVGLALASALRIEHLRTAVESRTVIGQAQGIVMQRYGLDAETAWRSMTRVSQHRNVKVREVADLIVRDRELPGLAETAD
ncbi:GAF and ANTAR domain-containing protein [Solicola sp. PLA-1-18]|uniref:GAF and ANTAR domain-containing protein n=1 Tax=Solicola sp. PLA-1-18 TaxID=3380532 RepID=UPI003B790CB1